MGECFTENGHVMIRSRLSSTGIDRSTHTPNTFGTPNINSDDLWEGQACGIPGDRRLGYTELLGPSISPEDSSQTKAVY